MAKELMWVCALLPDAINKDIIDLCRKANANTNLPENVFKFPLHISMKKSFYTHDFEEVKKATVEFIHHHGVLTCQTSGITLYKGMLWMKVNNKDFIEWHHEYDQFLKDRFGIPIDQLDVNYQAHVSLFTKGDTAKMETVLAELNSTMKTYDMTVEKFVIGSSCHNDEIIHINT